MGRVHSARQALARLGLGALDEGVDVTQFADYAERLEDAKRKSWETEARRAHDEGRIPLLCRTCGAYWWCGCDSRVSEFMLTLSRR